MKIIRVFALVFGISVFTFLITYYGFSNDHSNVLIQFLNYYTDILQGDFGISSISGQSVLSEIKARWPATIELGIVSLFLSISIGIPMGIIAALNQKNLIDRFIISISLTGYSIPIFWLALLMILLFSIALDLTPVSGRLNVMYDVTPTTGFMLIDTLLNPTIKKYHFDAFYSAVSHLILPTIVLACIPTAILARTTRASMLEILAKDFILTARAKGLSESKVILIHGLRNALPNIISVVGLLFISTVVVGSIVTEVIFAWPGIGNYIIQSVYARDHSVIQLFLLAMGIIVVFFNAIVDLIIYSLNPKKLNI